MRVYELAKELGVENRDLVSRIRGLGIQVANHMSMLEGGDADKVRRAMVREKQDTLEEVRLSATVIRRRSRTAAPSSAAPEAVAVAQPAPQRVVVRAPRIDVEAPVQAKVQPSVPVNVEDAMVPARIERPTEVRERPAPPVVVEMRPAPVAEQPARETAEKPHEAPEVETAAAPSAPSEPVAPTLPAPPPTERHEKLHEKTSEPPARGPAIEDQPPARPPARDVVPLAAKAPSGYGSPAPGGSSSGAAHAGGSAGGLTASSRAGEEDKPRFRTIPQPVVTGSAATGQFIQLPGMQPRDGGVRIEIKDRDEELRRLGRGAVNRAAPAGQTRFGRGAPGGGGGFAGPGGRPGGPPRKRQVAAGKKIKQTQITTPAEHKRVIRMDETITVSDLAQKMGVKGNEVIKRLWALGMMGITINHTVDQDTATLVANEFGYQVESVAFREEDVLSLETADAEDSLKLRAPVVTIMGHVDHGKTSLLDSIRQANVAEGEAGGITQHIGAYRVTAPGGDVVFLDTPGHEAFTAMRARGAKMTDIVVLVVAADDGPMPQTIEAVKHAQAAEVPILVAVNKIDKPGANPGLIRNKMMEHGLVPEEFGGETIFIDVSAKTGEGIDKLLEMLALQADVLELRANPDKPAHGHIIEARLDRSRGPISTVLVENGTLKLGDLVVAGTAMGKVRAMLDDKTKPISEAGPATPVEVLGLDGVPDAGDTFNVVADEKLAKQLVEHRRQSKRSKEAAGNTRGVSLENILDKIREGEIKEVKIVLKADVQGSVEAIAAALVKLSTSTVGVNVISSGVGGITESDVMLAKASSAIVIGFNVRPAGKAQPLAEQESVDIKTYQVIYDAIDDVKKAMVGLLAPVSREKVLGKVEIRQLFTLPKAGNIAGSFVLEGKITRKAQVRLVRDSVVIYTGRLGSLRRFKDDVSEVEKGYECGLTIEGYNDVREKDVIEAFEVEQIAATLADAGISARD
jgi:translation initiation factor IF-2